MWNGVGEIILEVGPLQKLLFGKFGVGGGFLVVSGYHFGVGGTWTGVFKTMSTFGICGTAYGAGAVSEEGFWC